MIDIRLRAPSEAAMAADLRAAAPFLSNPGEWALVLLGPVVDEEGRGGRPTRKNTAYHANLRVWGALERAEAAFADVPPNGTERVFPRSPSVIWAGD